MSATASTSEPAFLRTPAIGRQRAEGAIAVRVETIGGAPRAVRIAESGSSRLRLPRPENGLEAIMMNIAGGLACGDRMKVTAEAGADAELTLSTPGAERVYRSDGPETHVTTDITLESRARLAWLPQETILYDGARLRRRLEAELAGDASLTVHEAIVFGRRAYGEEVRFGMIEDGWRVRRGGELVFAETLRLDGPIRELLSRSAVAAGATGIATLLHVAPDAEAKLDAVRAALSLHDVEYGVTAWNGMLVARILSPLAERLKRAARGALPILTGRPPPRVWSS